MSANETATDDYWDKARIAHENVINLAGKILDLAAEHMPDVDAATMELAVAECPAVFARRVSRSALVALIQDQGHEVRRRPAFLSRREQERQARPEC